MFNNWADTSLHHLTLKSSMRKLILSARYLHNSLLNYNKLDAPRGSGNGGTIDRALVSDTRGLGFESCHRKFHSTFFYVR